MWQNAVKTAGVKEGAGVSVVLPGRRKPIAIFRWQNAFYAVADECTHAYAPFSEGEVKDFIITCPWHGAQFDIRTGEGVGTLAYPAVRTFPTRVLNDDVQVDV